MQRPLVSILIPFKNTASFIEECLQSIINQNYKSWEVLAVNDHSTDSSLEIVRRYTSEDSHIQYLQNDGIGIIEALRTAYSKSKGHLITRMDSDDIMTPNKLQIMVNALVTNGIGHIAIGQVKYFSKRGISNGYERYQLWLNSLTANGTNYSEIYKECVIPSPCWMTYREDLEACSAFEANRYPEDYDLAFRFYEKRLKCIPCEEILHLWRDYDHRTSRTSEHYAENYFLNIKLHYFLKLNYTTKRRLVVWGAGAKGKSIAKNLLRKEIAFYWVCDNSNKIGNDIYGLQMLHFTAIEELENPQCIITVANSEAQAMIQKYLAELQQENMKDYFFFC